MIYEDFGFEFQASAINFILDAQSKSNSHSEETVQSSVWNMFQWISFQQI